MTRLYVDIICARCGEAYGVSNEIRYDKDGIPIDIVEGLCLNCRCQEFGEAWKEEYGWNTP